MSLSSNEQIVPIKWHMRMCVCMCARACVCVCEICVSNVVWVNAGQESKQALVNALYIQ
jgi:hypothetical protein